VPTKKFTDAAAFLSTDQTEPPLLTKPQLAKLCSVHPRTIEQWMVRKRIPYFKIGKAVRFRKSDVEKALARYLVQEVA
jgi:excisionase family DNA binding protein